MPEISIKIARNFFPRICGGGVPPAPVSYAYAWLVSDFVMQRYIGWAWVKVDDFFAFRVRSSIVCRPVM